MLLRGPACVRRRAIVVTVFALCIPSAPFVSSEETTRLGLADAGLAGLEVCTGTSYVAMTTGLGFGSFVRATFALGLELPPRVAGRLLSLPPEMRCRL